jgi:hypothetical protein
MRNYIKALVDKLGTSPSGCSTTRTPLRWMPRLCLEATACELIGTIGKLIRGQEVGEPCRSPRSESYRENDEAKEGFCESDVCAAIRADLHLVGGTLRGHRRDWIPLQRWVVAPTGITATPGMLASTNTAWRD